VNTVLAILILGRLDIILKKNSFILFMLLTRFLACFRIGGGTSAVYKNQNHTKMNKLQALQTLRPMTFLTVKIKSNKKPLKAFADKTITKITKCTVGCGGEYKNLASNKGRETGGLPWGEWEVYPYAIAHKGNRYLRLYYPKNIKTSYLVDGEPTDSKTARWMIQGEQTWEDQDGKRVKVLKKNDKQDLELMTVREAGLVSIKQKEKELVNG
tara:strand:- start:282 stop:917 length:636 start_codon:yes stop_codon:yes gene_type:complete